MLPPYNVGVIPPLLAGAPLYMPPACISTGKAPKVTPLAQGGLAQPNAWFIVNAPYILTSPNVKPLSTVPLAMPPLGKALVPTPLPGDTPSTSNGVEPIVNAPPIVLSEILFRAIPPSSPASCPWIVMLLVVTTLGVTPFVPAGPLQPI